MSKVIIGTTGGKNVGFDLDVLLPTRGLITADSGGGKSWLIRVLLEQFFGKVQTITIDPEGEFATLREKFPFVLVGKGGETPADPRSAALLARRLLELRASAVCDLYELPTYLQHEWVKAFLEGLIKVPKELYTPCVVIVDEAHTFCPEKGKGESIARPAMIDLCTKGRKRGLCAIWATQALAKVDKDATGMLQNRLLGPTFEDVNRKRAAEMLGILPGADTRTFFDAVKMLEPGNFFAFGRAISRDRILVQIREVQTTHPKAFQKHSAPPPPAPAKIKALLPKLADLPKEAEETARTTRDLMAEIKSLKQQLAGTKNVPTGIKTIPDPQAIERAVAAALKPHQTFRALTVRQTGQVAVSLASFQTQLEKIFQQAITALERIADAAANASPNSPMVAVLPTPASPQREPDRPAVMRPQPVVTLPAPKGAPERQAPAESDGQSRFGKPERTLLSILATHGPCSTAKLAILGGYAADGGGFRNPLSRLRSAGYITPLGTEPMDITEAGHTAIGSPDPLPQGRALLDFWMRHSRVEHAEREILRVLSENPRLRPMPKEEIASLMVSKKGTAYEVTGGGFRNPLSCLRTLGLVQGFDTIEFCAELREALS